MKDLSGEQIGLYILAVLLIIAFISPFFMRIGVKKDKKQNIAIIGEARYIVPDVLCRYDLLQIDGQYRRVRTILGRPFTPGYRVDLYDGIAERMGEREKVYYTYRLS